MSGFQGDPAQFAQASTDLEDIKTQMDQNMGTLRNNIEATRAGWDGPAARLFQQVMERFDEKSRKCNEALQHIGDMLNQSGKMYGTSDESSTSAVNSAVGDVLG